MSELLEHIKFIRSQQENQEKQKFSLEEYRKAKAEGRPMIGRLKTQPEAMPAGNGASSQFPQGQKLIWDENRGTYFDTIAQKYLKPVPRMEQISLDRTIVEAESTKPPEKPQLPPTGAFIEPAIRSQLTEEELATFEKLPPNLQEAYIAKIPEKELSPDEIVRREIEYTRYIEGLTETEWKEKYLEGPESTPVGRAYIYGLRTAVKGRFGGLPDLIATIAGKEPMLKDQPTTSLDRIAVGIGGVYGFVTGYPLKIARNMVNLLPRELYSKWLRKKVGEYGAELTDRMMRTGAEFAIANFLSYQGGKSISEDLKLRTESALYGLYTGIGFGGLMSIDPKLLRMLAMMGYTGLPKTIQDATTEEQVYEYLLGAWFAWTGGRAIMPVRTYPGESIEKTTYRQIPVIQRRTGENLPTTITKFDLPVEKFLNDKMNNIESEITKVENEWKEIQKTTGNRTKMDILENRIVELDKELSIAIQDLMDYRTGKVLEAKPAEIILPIEEVKPAIEAEKVRPAEVVPKEEVIKPETTFDMHIDDITLNTKLTSQEALKKLLDMELAGRVKQLPGQRFRITADILNELKAKPAEVVPIAEAVKPAEVTPEVPEISAGKPAVALKPEEAIVTPPAVKEPWEMTKSEWVSPEAELIQEYESIRKQYLKQANNPDPDSPIYRAKIMDAHEEFFKRHPEIDHTIFLQRKGKLAHKDYVRRALMQSKSVPVEVLKDYPDLAEKYNIPIKGEQYAKGIREEVKKPSEKERLEREEAERLRLRDIEEKRVEAQQKEVKPKIQELYPTNRVFEMRPDAIDKDVENFQKRETDYSPETVNRIVEAGYKDIRAGTIIVWIKPETNRYICISGYSRLEATIILIEKGKLPKNFKVKVEIFEGTFEEAINEATISNNLGTGYKIKEKINIYKTANNAKETLGKDYNSIARYSYLDPNGKFMQLLREEKPENKPSGLNQRAYQVGELKMNNPDKLTLTQENQIFNYLFMEGKSSRVYKERLVENIESQIRRIDYVSGEKLILKGERLITGLEARADTEIIAKRIIELDKRQDEIIRQINRLTRTKKTEKRDAEINELQGIYFDNEIEIKDLKIKAKTILEEQGDIFEQLDNIYEERAVGIKTEVKPEPGELGYKAEIPTKVPEAKPEAVPQAEIKPIISSAEIAQKYNIPDNLQRAIRNNIEQGFDVRERGVREGYLLEYADAYKREYTGEKPAEVTPEVSEIRTEKEITNLEKYKENLKAEEQAGYVKVPGHNYNPKSKYNPLFYKIASLFRWNEKGEAVGRVIKSKYAMEALNKKLTYLEEDMRTAYNSLRDKLIAKGLKADEANKMLSEYSNEVLIGERKINEKELRKKLETEADIEGLKGKGKVKYINDGIKSAKWQPQTTEWMADKLGVDINEPFLRFLNNFKENRPELSKEIAEYFRLEGRNKITNIIESGEGHYITRFYLRWLDKARFKPNPENYNKALEVVKSELTNRLEKFAKSLNKNPDFKTKTKLNNLYQDYRNYLKYVDDVESPSGKKFVVNMEQVEKASENYIELLLTRKKRAISGGRFGINIENLISRKLEDVFRNLYGEVKDPVAEMIVTQRVQEGMLIRQKLFEDMYREGQGTIWDSFYRKDQGFIYQLNGTKYGNMDGKWVKWDLNKFLNPKKRTPTFNIYATALGYSRLSKVFRLSTMERNFISNPMFATLCGDGIYIWRLPKIGKDMIQLSKALKANEDITFKFGDEIITVNAREFYLKLYESGMLGKGTTGTTARDVPILLDIGHNRLNKAIVKASEAYGLIDYPFKVMSYFLHRNLGKTHQEAVDWVLDHYQNPTRVSEITKKMTSLPFVGDYITYKFDSTRIYVNALKTAITEFRKGNIIPLTGFIMANALTASIAYKKTQYVIGKINDLIEKDEKKKFGQPMDLEIQRKMRYYLRSYYVDDLKTMWYGKDGEPQILVLEYNFPISISNYAISSLQNSENIAEASKLFLQRLVKETFNAPMLIQFATEFLKGEKPFEKEYGEKGVLDITANTETKEKIAIIKERLKKFGMDILPLGLDNGLQLLENHLKAKEDRLKPNRFGQVRTSSDILKQMILPMRIMKLNSAQLFTSKLKEMKSKIYEVDDRIKPLQRSEYERTASKGDLEELAGLYVQKGELYGRIKDIINESIELFPNLSKNDNQSLKEILVDEFQKTNATILYDGDKDQIIDYFNSKKFKEREYIYNPEEE